MERKDYTEKVQENFCRKKETKKKGGGGGRGGGDKIRETKKRRHELTEKEKILKAKEKKKP